MAAPTVNASVGTSLNAASANYLVNYPASAPVSGEVLIATIHCRLGSLTIASPPAGWNLITNGNSGYSFWSYWKLAAGGETGSVSFTGSGSSVNATAMVRVAGADTTSPIDIAAPFVTPSTFSTITFPDVTTLGPDRLIIAWCGHSTNASTVSTWNNGLAQLWSQATGTGTTVRASHGAQKTQAAAGSTAPLTVTLTGSTAYDAQTIAIKPSGGAAAATSFVFPTETVQRKLMRR